MRVYVADIRYSMGTLQIWSLLLARGVKNHLYTGREGLSQRISL